MANTDFDSNGIPIGSILPVIPTVEPMSLTITGPTYGGVTTSQQFTESFGGNVSHQEQSASQDKTIDISEQVTPSVTTKSTKTGGGGTQKQYETHRLQFSIEIPISLSPA